MTTRNFHLSMDVRGALRRADKYLVGVFRSTETGKTMTPKQAREYLMSELAKGHEVIPCADDCEGFDFVDGCPGHEVN